MTSLDGKSALETGASRGIGRSIPLGMTRKGAGVFVHRNRDASATGIFHGNPGNGAAGGRLVLLADPCRMLGSVVLTVPGNFAFMTGRMLFLDGGWSGTGRLPEEHFNPAEHRERT